MKSYLDVAQECGLEGKTKARFLYYMRARWSDSEEVKCQVGYAAEWANRFKGGVEYQVSDSVGQAILNQMDGLFREE